MSTAEIGIVLATMAGYAKERADARRYYLGPENTELLFAISHMLHEGAQHCLNAAKVTEANHAAP